MMYLTLDPILTCLGAATNIVMFEDIELAHRSECELWYTLIERNTQG